MDKPAPQQPTAPAESEIKENADQVVTIPAAKLVGGEHDGQEVQPVANIPAPHNGPKWPKNRN